MYHAFAIKLSVLYKTHSHHGFLTCHSCSTQLLLGHHDQFKVLDRSDQVNEVLNDFSKVFDLACHDILLTKLYRYGVRGVLVQRLSSAACSSERRGF